MLHHIIQTILVYIEMYSKVCNGYLRWPRTQWKIAETYAHKSLQIDPNATKYIDERLYQLGVKSAEIKELDLMFPSFELFPIGLPLDERETAREDEEEDRLAMGYYWVLW